MLASTTCELVQCGANRYGETRNAGCRPRVFLCCFSPCLCYTRDVADLSELIVARDAQSPFVGARGTSACCVQGSFQFAFRYFLVEPDVSPHLNRNRTDCVRVQ